MQDNIRKHLRSIDLACGAAVVVVLAATGLLGIMPLQARARQNIAEAANLRSQLAQLDGLSKTLGQVEADMTSTAGRLGEAETRLPTSGAMDQFMAQLARVAEEAGLQVNAITPKPLADADNYKVMPVEISGSGSFETCYKFITGLRKMNRLTRLDDLVLQIEDNAPSQDRLSEKPTVRISIGISTFMAR